MDFKSWRRAHKLFYGSLLYFMSVVR